MDADTNADRRDLRAEIGKYVSLTSFPATAEKLIEAATTNSAPEAVVNRLRSMRPGTELPNSRALWVALGLESDHRF